jgi:isoleucyl-tRNA synthetase
VTVALDLGLDDELVLEGEAYELIHQVNSLRKERGFELTDRIALTVPEAQRKLADRHGEWISREVLATSIDVGETLEIRKS